MTARYNYRDALDAGRAFCSHIRHHWPGTSDRGRSAFMCTCVSIGLSFVPLVVTSVAHAQGTFRNMDFELSQIPQNQPAGVVSANLAFPFWTVYYGTNQQTQVHWAEVSVGATEASLIGQTGYPTAIDGGYSLSMYGGNVSVSISQVGQLPSDAVSLLFKAQFGGPGFQLNVSIGGVSLPIFDVSRGPNYTLYGVNCSQFSGMQEDLRFTIPAVGSSGPSAWDIDDIVFSSTPVPEPSSPALLSFGVLVLLWHLLRKPNPITAPDAASPRCLHSDHLWRGTGEFLR